MKFGLLIVPVPTTPLLAIISVHTAPLEVERNEVDFEGKIYDIPVSVCSDFSSILVQTKPGGFIFLFEKEINEAKEKFEKDMDESARDLEQKLVVLKEKLNQ